MVDVEIVKGIVSRQLDPEKDFVVDLTISSGNKVLVLIDSDEGLTIDRCVKISRAIEQELDREQEDFELEVSSPGLSMPLKVERQFHKNIGRDVELTLISGDKHVGRLIAASKEGFSIEIKELVKSEGKKRKELSIRKVDFLYSDVISTKVVISFR
jgi:ribosome maturation factor RimP